MEAEPQGAPLTFHRTLLGDVPSSEMGITYSHEHILIEGGYVGETFPDFRLNSLEKAVEELQGLAKLGVKTLVDSMPTAAGRSPARLAEASRQTGLHILCPTGLHLPVYYPPGHWSHHLDEDRLASLFIAEIEEGLDSWDANGPFIERLPHRAGLVKVAGGLDALSDREIRAFRAAAQAHRATGCPILTHTEQGTAGLEQARLLLDEGVRPSSIVLSHLDRNPDLAYHREVLSTGVVLEFDSAFRWKGGANHTLTLILQLIPEFPDQIVLGMDAARPSYWRSYGGSPGLDFLATTFSERLRAEGLSQDDLDRIFISTPSRAFSFVPR